MFIMLRRAFSKVGAFAKVGNLCSTFRFNKTVHLKTCSTYDKPSEKEQIYEDQRPDDSYEENIKVKILKSSLPFVSVHGWSKNTVCAGANELGYPDTIHGLFEDPGADLALYFYSNCNDSLSQLIKDGKLKCLGEDKPELIEFLSSAIQTRLLMIEPYLSQWPEAMALLSKPSNATKAVSNLMTLVDDICYHAGDRSIDTRWYTRRVGLAAIYKSSELHFLQDKSQEYIETWSFVRRAIKECVKLDNMLESNTRVAKDVVNASVLTAKNILGFTWNR
ncbi:ubiquinone biosynthesis protein COQ9, mitochondrial isoform X3 [Adelges cooleyi]|uniref:ubiquinone biosynthesis protein COQ9, mitochondrial isoform X3 n=1 Tax=Adelges cooleyi TaxID=133065 RepID=UPI0021801DF3|nr:ubiquinone biosynthesis protein COQ9, mitochondrial isoform X3 [Adelges cooleyi]